VIRQQTIDQIFSAASIEEIVGDYVKLKRSGSGMGGLCPFHNEKTPSFKVSPALGIYKCFGCGRGGNVIDFVMEMEKMSYPETLRHLASKYHIEIEEDNTNKEELSEQVKLRDSLYLAIEFAAKVFHNNLLNDEEGKRIGYSYFLERGITPQTIESFQLGYTLNSWEHFSAQSLKMGYDATLLERLGLIKSRGEGSSDSGYYDIYRERVMFPIRNLMGKVVGFGGRQLRNEAKSPKYINSPENEIYHKSSILYGLFEAKKEIRITEKALLVEGYLDVLMLHQSGLGNAVATSGTSLTTEQVKLLKRFTDNVTLLFDGDPAGIKAALRGVDLLLEGGLNVKVVAFPDGEDPDSYCRKVGGKKMEEFVRESEEDFLLFKTQLLLKEKGRDPIGLSETAREVVKSIIKITDPIKRNAYIRQCAAILEFDEELLMAEAKRLKQTDGRGARRRTQQEDAQTTFIQPTVELDPVVKDDLKNKERALVQTLMVYGIEEYQEGVDVAGFVFSELENDDYQFENRDLAEAFQEARGYYDFHNKLDENFFTRHKTLAKMAASVLSVKYKLSPAWWEQHEIVVKTDAENYREEVIANLNYLKLYKVDKFLNRAMEQLKSAETEEESIQFQNKIFQIRQVKKTITSLLGIEGAIPE
jgi:DNA primase